MSGIFSDIFIIIIKDICPQKEFLGTKLGTKTGDIPIYSVLPISKTDTDLKNTPKRSVQFILECFIVHSVLSKKKCELNPIKGI